MSKSMVWFSLRQHNEREREKERKGYFSSKSPNAKKSWACGRIPWKDKVLKKQEESCQARIIRLIFLWRPRHQFFLKHQIQHLTSSEQFLTQLCCLIHKTAIIHRRLFFTSWAEKQNSTTKWFSILHCLVFICWVQTEQSTKKETDTRELLPRGPA